MLLNRISSILRPLLPYGVCLVLSLYGLPAYSQTPYTPNSNSVADAANVLGAINVMKTHLQTCISRGMVIPPANQEVVKARLKSWEKLEIEMYYFLVAKAVEIDQVTQQRASEMIQDLVVNSRRNTLSAQTSDQLTVMCNGLPNRLASKAADFDYMYNRLLTNIRAKQ